MSLAVRQLWAKAVKHGRQILNNFGKKQAGEKEVAETVVARAEKDLSSARKTRLVLIDTISRRTLQTAVADLRRQAALRLSAYARPAARGGVSNLALVGFGLAAGSKLYGPVDQYGHNLACSQIKEMFGDLIERSQPGSQTDHVIGDDVCVEDFKFGHLIGKGCNAAVYSAKYSEDLGEAVETEDVYLSSDEESFVVLDSDEEMTSQPEIAEKIMSRQDDDQSHDLAIKMIFNYDMESNAASILQGLGCEVVPARHVSLSQKDNIWHNGNHVKKKSMRCHANIVDMPGVFVDRVPDLPGARENFPDALPARLNPDGFGRNSTLFLVMKRYKQTLHEYLKGSNISLETRILLLVQLTEAIVHMSSNNIAHRDIKADNILVEDLDGVAHLVLGDFGCCLSQQNESLYLAYPNSYVCKGGNGALMAPEIACASPGFGVWLDYSKSDLWAAGAVAYEILGAGNPFYRGSHDSQRLDSRTYRDVDLPQLPESIPEYLKTIVELMTRRNPKQRASASVVANMLHLVLWAPTDWRTSPPRAVTVMEWLGLMAVQCIISRADMPAVEFDLKMTFLSRVEFEDLMTAIHLLSA